MGPNLFLLGTQNGCTVPTLSESLLAELSVDYGITVTKDHYGLQVAVTTKGLCYLLNFFDLSSVNRSFNLKMLKELAGRNFWGDWRELRVLPVQVPVYDHAGFRLMIYLNGTPPVLSGISRFLRQIEGSVSLLGVYDFISGEKITHFDLVFTQDELMALKSNNHIRIGLCR